MIKKYRKRPVVIEAIRFDGNNADECLSFIDSVDDSPLAGYNKDKTSIFITTLEGEMKARVGDYIIKGVSDEFYPCKPDIFVATYEVVDD